VNATSLTMRTRTSHSRSTAAHRCRRRTPGIGPVECPDNDVFGARQNGPSSSAARATSRRLASASGSRQPRRSRPRRSPTTRSERLGVERHVVQAGFVGDQELRLAGLRLAVPCPSAATSAPGTRSRTATDTCAAGRAPCVPPGPGAARSLSGSLAEEPRDDLRARMAQSRSPMNSLAARSWCCPTGPSITS